MKSFYHHNRIFSIVNRGNRGKEDSYKAGSVNGLLIPHELQKVNGKNTHPYNDPACPESLVRKERGFVTDYFAGPFNNQKYPGQKSEPVDRNLSKCRLKHPARNDPGYPDDQN